MSTESTIKDLKKRFIEKAIKKKNPDDKEIDKYVIVNPDFNIPIANEELIKTVALIDDCWFVMSLKEEQAEEDEDEEFNIPGGKKTKRRSV